MLRIKVIACDVLNREISYLSSLSKHFVDVTFLRQGLHLTPTKLTSTIQDEIDRVNEGVPNTHYVSKHNYDYIVIAYGLCSNGIIGISSSKIPLIIPRAHDCITLLLGSKELYKDYFNRNPGTYWFSPGWIERGILPSEENFKAVYFEYVDKYGEENAEYLIKQEKDSLSDYTSAAYIDWGVLDNSGQFKAFTSQAASYFKWGYSEVQGSPELLSNMLNGIFNENEVLILPPGKKVMPSYKDDIIKAE